MRTNIVLVCPADPLALEPLGPMGPVADADRTSGALELDPLSPVDREAQAVGAGASNSDHTKRAVTS
jgi:hypothetical protein